MKYYLKQKMSAGYGISMKLKTSAYIADYYSTPAPPDYILVIDFYDSLFNAPDYSFLAFDTRPNYIGGDQVPSVDFFHPNHVNSLEEGVSAPKIGFIPVSRQEDLGTYFFKVNQVGEEPPGLGLVYYTNSENITEGVGEFIRELDAIDTLDFSVITRRSRVLTDTAKVLSGHRIRNDAAPPSDSFNSHMLWINENYSGSFREIAPKVNSILNASLFELNSPVINTMLYTANFPFTLDKRYMLRSFYHTLPLNPNNVLPLGDLWTHYLAFNLNNQAFYAKQFEWLYSGFIILGDPTIQYRIPTRNTLIEKALRKVETTSSISPFDIQISPNPGNANVMIQLGDQIHVEKISVYDIKGRKLFTKSVTPETRSIELPEVESFASGTYFMKIHTLGQKTFIRKFTLAK
ncbi:MAG: T9SS type A sorting domain-containing protein [Candidatus Marinimicrobia bacterium]|nr:T9SS type A sorting domain-containing protein [Candidatus Neomarinimicrobiota bacterium]MCF7902658.1 T9SS type A sorting domain-containing protein [Candidatus Neomarinimicrobiota bacterium]